jgi:hypothetical protein
MGSFWHISIELIDLYDFIPLGSFGFVFNLVAERRLPVRVPKPFDFSELPGLAGTRHGLGVLEVQILINMGILVRPAPGWSHQPRCATAS